MKLAPSNITLIRGLGLIAAISIVVGNVIGTGVFLKTRVMICNVGSPSKVIVVWIAAGVLSLAGALTYAELAAMMPRAGGEYVFLREAYGARWGFLYGWMQFFVARAGGLAAMSIAFAIFLNDLMGGALNQVFFTRDLFGYKFSFGSVQLVALSAIAVVTFINCAAVVVSGNIAAVLTALKISLVLAVGIGALLLAQGDWGHLLLTDAGGVCEDVSASARGGMAGFGAAMLGALWAYNGWNDLTLVAGEVKNPQRNIPLALIGGMTLVGALYLFVNFAYFYVLTPTELANVPTTSSVAAEAARRFMGPLALSLIAAGMMASSFGTLHIGVLTGARVPYAMARDRLFFQNLARLSKRTHVPVGSLLVQALWAGVLALSGSFDALSNYSIFGLWIFYALTTATVFVFRRRRPELPRPYRTWGYPVVPALFLLAAAWLLIMTVLSMPRQAVTGIILIALGLPVYYFWHGGKQVVSEHVEDS
ncbi:MAG: amino acid permease [Acidobacteria bacterium]|nr:amino acid permease [Acidobacteriota bacterium]